MPRQTKKTEDDQRRGEDARTPHETPKILKPQKAADERAQAVRSERRKHPKLDDIRKKSRHGEAPSPGAGRSPTHKPKSKLAKDLFLATKGYLDCLFIIPKPPPKKSPPQKKTRRQSKLAKKIFSQARPRTPRRTARSQRDTDTVGGGAAVEREDERT